MNYKTVKNINFEAHNNEYIIGVSFIFRMR